MSIVFFFCNEQLLIEITYFKEKLLLIENTPQFNFL